MDLIPVGAMAIADARKRGMKPDRVFVSAIGRFAADCPVVVADHAFYDWSWALGLDVTVVLEPGRGGDVLKAVAGVAENCHLYDRKAKRGAHVLPIWVEKKPGACLADIDADIASHYRRWFPEWRHPEKWGINLKLVPWWNDEQEAMQWLT